MGTTAHNEPTIWFVNHATRTYNRHTLHPDGHMSHERLWAAPTTASPASSLIRSSTLRRATTDRKPRSAGTTTIGWACVPKATRTTSAHRRASPRRRTSSDSARASDLQEVVGTSWRPRGPGADNQYFVLPNVPSSVTADVPFVPHGPTRRKTTTANIEQMSTGSGWSATTPKPAPRSTRRPGEAEGLRHLPRGPYHW